MKTYRLVKTRIFLKWLEKQPGQVISRIDARLDRVRTGNFGDHKWFGDFGELRLTFGKGYRLYYTIRQQELLLLLLGGDKGSQTRDIKAVKMILNQLEQE